MKNEDKNHGSHDPINKPFAVFDIDGTLIRWQLYHSIFDHLAKQSLLDSRKTSRSSDSFRKDEQSVLSDREVAKATLISEKLVDRSSGESEGAGILGESSLIDADLYKSVKAARLSWKKRKSGFREYELALIRAYDKTLEYLTREQLNAAIEETFEEYKEQVYTYTRDLIADLKNKNYMLLAISGSHNDIVERVAKHYGFDDWVGTIYHQQNGRFTGEYTIPALKKDRALQDFINKHKLSTKSSIGVGDSEGDIPMLELVENPIAFNPEQKLFNHARQKGWRVVIERKNMIYELESKAGKYELAKTNAG